MAWTAFDRGAGRAGLAAALSRERPDWEPAVLLERAAAQAELWFPSLSGSRLAYTEVRYAPTGRPTSGTVYLLDLTAIPGAEPERLDDSGLATMPILGRGHGHLEGGRSGVQHVQLGRMVG